MKKFKVAALLMCFVAFSFAMTSCQKSEDLIIGKWKCVKVVDEGQTYTEGGEIGMTWEFKADNTVIVEMQGFAAPAATYSIKDDVLTLSIFGETTSMNIDKINKKSMILSDLENPKNTAEFEKM